MDSLPANQYLNPNPTLQLPEELNLASIHTKLDFFHFVHEYELKYFSKLIARPVCLKLINRDQTEYEQPLIYSIDFKFWENFFKVSMSNNWFQIRSKY
jgi:hypothetical protein